MTKYGTGTHDVKITVTPPKRERKPWQKRPLPDFLGSLSDLLARRSADGASYRYWVWGLRPYLRINRKWQVIIIREGRHG